MKPDTLVNLNTKQFLPYSKIHTVKRYFHIAKMLEENFEVYNVSM